MALETPGEQKHAVRTAEPHGVLNLFKPKGPTSHDCVAKVRRALRTRRVGHAGTLDPLACGVLVIGVGYGTRILEYLQGLPKTYRARMVFGVETDSQDVTGAVVTDADASGVTEAQVREHLTTFQGEIMQVPPMVSALKIGGRRLYDIARQGETVHRDARPITVYEIELLSFEAGARAEAEIRVKCSAGTYVRTLCHDLGALLGPGASMSALEREAIGTLRSDEAASLDELDEQTPLVSLAEALSHLPSIDVEPSMAARLLHGQFIPVPETTPDGPIRALDGSGNLLAVGTARGHGAARLFSPDKVFPPSAPPASSAPPNEPVAGPSTEPAASISAGS